jgi:hypothetical protein
MSYLFPQNELYIIKIINKILVCVSISGSVFIVFVFWFFKNRQFTLELVLWYSLSNLMNNISYLFPYDPKNLKVWCAAQSFTMSTFENASMIWTCIIGYTAFISVIKKSHVEKYKYKYRLLFLLLSFGISAGIATM